MTDRARLALDAVKARPGCTAWALGILVDPPHLLGVRLSVSEWRALLEEELPKLHRAGRVDATRYGLGAIAYWPTSYDVPESAGQEVLRP